MTILLVEDNDASADMLEPAPDAPRLPGDRRPERARGPRPRRPGAPRRHPDGSQPARPRRLGDDAAAQGESHRPCAIPVIALTANALVSDRERAFAAGCVDFETKPVDFDRLIARIRAVMVEWVGHA